MMATCGALTWVYAAALYHLTGTQLDDRADRDQVAIIRLLYSIFAARLCILVGIITSAVPYIAGASKIWCGRFCGEFGVSIRRHLPLRSLTSQNMGVS
jgi:hypothetical protein